jgi:hypothetical protein
MNWRTQLLDDSLQGSLHISDQLYRGSSYKQMRISIMKRHSPSPQNSSPDTTTETPDLSNLSKPPNPPSAPAYATPTI